MAKLMRVYGPMYMYLDYYPTYSDELPENFEKIPTYNVVMDTL